MQYRNFDLNAAFLTVSFKCNECGEEVISENIVVPTPDMAADTAHDSTSSESYDVTCESCEHEYEISVHNSYAGGSIDVNEDIEDLDIDEHYSIDDDYFADLYTDIPEDIAFYTADNSLNYIQQLLANAPQSYPLANVFCNLLYSNAITTMEAYLSDTLISLITSSDVYLRKFVTTYKDYKSISFCLNNLYSVHNDISQRVKESLREIIYHHLSKVSGIYKDTLGIQFPSYKELYKAVIIRHDIVHRNGKTKDSMPLFLEEKDVTAIVDEIRSFIGNINTQVTALPKE